MSTPTVISTFTNFVNAVATSLVFDVGPVQVDDIICLNWGGLTPSGLDLATVTDNNGVTWGTGPGWGPSGQISSGGNGMIAASSQRMLAANSDLQVTLTFNTTPGANVEVWGAGAVIRNGMGSWTGAPFFYGALVAVGVFSTFPDSITSPLVCPDSNTLLVSIALGNNGLVSVADSFTQLATTGLVNGGSAAVASSFESSAGTYTSAWHNSALTTTDITQPNDAVISMWGFTGGPDVVEVDIAEVQVTVTYQNPANYLYARDIQSWGDGGQMGANNGQPYEICNIVLGSITLSQLGAPMFPLQHVVGYFNAAGTLNHGGSSYPDIWILPNEVNDQAGIGFVQLPEVIQEPPQGQNHPSESILALRWPVNMMNSALASQFMHHLQVKIQFEPENAPNTIKAISFKEEQD
jgi:hypothetical protein